MKKSTLFLASSLMVISVQAKPVTSIAGKVIPMELRNEFSKGPITQAPGIVWSSNSTAAMFGYQGNFDFHSNGFWRGAPPMADVEDDISTMEYAFDPPVAAVGALLNYVPDKHISKHPPVIAIYDRHHKLIESTTLAFKTKGGAGQFHGFQRPKASIAYFSLSKGFVGLRNLTVQTTLPAKPRCARSASAQARCRKGDAQ